jgi:hypothetical protein
MATAGTPISKYATTAINAAALKPTSQQTSGSSSGTTEGSTNSTSEMTGSGTSVNNTQNMTPQQLAALNNLIAQLSSGGTPAMKQDRNTRNQEIQTVQNNRAGYSKDSAFNDAQGLIAQTIRQALEKVLPGINSGSLGAGSSQSSMRALLTQKAALEASQAASAQGLTAAVNYGQISNGMTTNIAQLLGIQDPATAALINALAVSKGSVVNSTTNTNNNQTTNTTGTTSGNTTGVQNQNQNTQYGASNSNIAPSTSNSFVQYGGGTVDNIKANSQVTSNQALIDMVNEQNGGSFVNDYTF